MAFFLLILLCPLILFILIIVGISVKGNPIFHQDRIGYNSNQFRIFKIKTMTDDKDDLGILLPDKERLFGFGRFIRKLSLDELPQLINVLNGDMSLIGPRPLLPDYLNFYSSFQNRRHDVKPGITGWAQVNGRNSISWEDKFNLDVWYVDNRSLILDFKILILTVCKVFRAKDISSDTSATMERFTGSQ